MYTRAEKISVNKQKKKGGGGGRNHSVKPLVFKTNIRAEIW
jgi:hypothetical protein